MKVFIDKNPLVSGHAVRGIGSYTRNLLEALKKKKDIQLVSSLSRADVAHYPYFDLFFSTLKVDPVIPTVVTIYDVIPLIYPAHYPPGIKGRLRFQRQKRELGKVSAIITISETSKKDIVRFLDVPQEKIYVTRLAPAAYFRKIEVTKRYKLPERFVLYVGDVNYNKNILGLAEACKKIGVPLVIVGKQAADKNFDKSHPENQPLVHLIEEYGNDPDVMRIGFVSDKDLVEIYNLATVYCQPSFYEGFGLPILEAQACGCPVVAAKTQALVEIAEDSCLFVDPKDPEDIADGLKKVLEDKKVREDLIKKGLQNAKVYSWEKTAQETVAVYEKIINK